MYIHNVSQVIGTGILIYMEECIYEDAKGRRKGGYFVIISPNY